MPASVGAVFARALAEEPAREALVTRSGRYSYAELDDLAHRATAALWALGVRRGDRVAVSLPNDTDVVVAFHGIMRLGAVWVGVNRNLAAPEKQWLLEDSGASVLLGEAELQEWADALAGAEPVELPPVDPYAPAGIAYTSGTTGHPKGAVHSQHNLLLPGAALVASRGYGPELRKGDCFPLTILNLQVLTTLLVAQAGGCSVIMDRIDAEGVADWIRRERVTTWNGPPALLHGMVEHDDVTAADLASLDEVWTGGGDCPEALRARFAAKFGTEVLATYGLSEVPTVVTIDDRAGGHRERASGRPLPHLDVRILDDAGRPVADGEPGEICVGAATEGPWAGAYRTMLGYLDRTEATAASLAGGILHTGDIGHIDADGHLHVRDRKNLVIIRGGANVYPAEVERVLGEAPGVGACAVLGVPDERLGERVAAVVEPAAGHEVDADVLVAHCRVRLARYKVPEQFAVVAALPRNAMGKVQRDRLSGLLSLPARPPGRSG
ncbi:MAG: AMP-dependent synthetase and ligase [Acidimicrobiales bacterium]|nr:AMP-dependent synthetase and ligase [Acidimicrobiales bacterium]